MRRSLSITFKTLLGHLILLGILVAGYFALIDIVIERFITHKVKQEVLQWVTDVKTTHSDTLQDILKHKAAQNQYYLQILNNDNDLVYESVADKHYDVSESHWLHMPFTTRLSLPVHPNGDSFTVVILFNYKKIALNCGDLKKIYVIVGAVFSVIFVILSLVMLAMISKPFQDIFRAVNNHAFGNSDQIPKLAIRGRSEAAIFARTLNQLYSDFQQRQHALEYEKLRTSSVLEALEEGVVTIDADQNVTYVNVRAVKLLEIAKDDLNNKNFISVCNCVKSQLMQKSHDLVKAALHNNTIMTDSLTTNAEEQSHIDIVAVPIGLGQGIALIFQDHATNQKVVSMGKEFIANASHELRTPITIIKGFAEMLHDLPEISASMLEDITEKIVRNCHRMSALVKNLLVLADLDNLPKASLEERDLFIVLDSCRHQLQTVHPDVKLDICEQEDEIIVKVDSPLFELALMNLLENAVKYSPSPATVRVRVAVKNDTVELTVSDQGMGIPANELNHIFDRFYTVNKAHSRKLGGAGLGLSIVRTIVEKHNGKLEVRSAVGEGTHFKIILPLSHSLIEA
ncbi:MAG: PAS domain-containing protein [Chlamydiales bacterium]|nr:PAS domain-containing protein [Chlamydiales bacterium]